MALFNCIFTFKKNIKNIYFFKLKQFRWQPNCALKDGSTQTTQFSKGDAKSLLSYHIYTVTKPLYHGKSYFSPMLNQHT